MTSNSAISPSAASGSRGALRKARKDGNGCAVSSRTSSADAAGQQPSACATTSPSSGDSETRASRATGGKLMITLNWPDRRLAPNRSAGRAWQSTRGLKDDAREWAFFETRAVMMGLADKFTPKGAVPLVLTFCPPDKRRRDLDGLLSASKHALDGIAKALGIDDSQFEPVTLRRGEKHPGGMLVVEVG